MSMSGIHAWSAPSLVLCLVMAACAQAPAGPAKTVWPGSPTAAQYDFSWRLSGHRELAPLQVFDDGRDTWLQFPSLQVTPAIFVDDGQGERLAAHEPAGPYVKVRGVWRALAFRGGNRQARAQYTGSARQPHTDTHGVSVHAVVDPAGVVSAVPAGNGEGDRSVAANMGPPPSSGAALPRPDAVLPDYAASPADGNMRRALTRWATQAGWTFETQHWSVEVDIPLAGTAAFGGDFIQAVRQLLAATELSAQPLQPCFYSNKVLRVVSWTQACDRGLDATGSMA